MTYIPPAVQSIITSLTEIGHSVVVRRNANGSNRYSVNGRRETNAFTMVRRFEAGKFDVRTYRDLPSPISHHDNPYWNDD